MTRRDKGPRPYPRPEPLTEQEAVAFVTRWARVVRAILVRVEHVPLQDLDDLMQDVLTDAWVAAKEGRLDARRSPAARGWFKVVAHRKAITARNRRVRVLLGNQEAAHREDDAELPLLARDVLRELQAATTPARWRAFAMQAQGMTVDQIAAVEHISPHTIRWRLRLAKRDLQAALNRERPRDPRRGKCCRKG